MGGTNSSDVDKTKSDNASNDHKVDVHERENRDNNHHDELMFDKKASFDLKIHDEDNKLKEREIASHDHEVELKHESDMAAVASINKNREVSTAQFKQIMGPGSNFNPPSGTNPKPPIGYTK